tara:strand:+ start:2908 stop:4149 length:1242 start_codon:yes stop_codon:yes gene_type:complete
MEIKFSNTINLKLLLNEIKAITTIKENKVSFEAFRIFELENVLESHIILPKKISNISKHSIVQKVIRKAAINGFDENEFREILQVEVNNHFKKKEQNFYLLTSLSIDSLPYRKIRINNSEILIKGKFYPKEFAINRKKLLAEKFVNDNNTDYLKIIVITKGKNDIDTFEESLRNLGVFRAILNLTLNPRIKIVFGKDDKPINQVRLGEFSTLHFENGKTINDNNYWYEPNFYDKTYHLENDNKFNLKKRINWYLKRINLSNKKLNESICFGLGLYVNAFDEPDKQSCFLKSWTALENLLSTYKNDVIIKRCLVVFHKESRPLQKQILEAIKNYRNEFVHEGTEVLNHSITVYCHHIQRNILYLLMYNHLKFYNLFNNIEEANEFLDKRGLETILQYKEMNMFNTIIKHINSKS